MWIIGLPVAFVVWYLAPSYYSDGNIRFTMHHGGKPGELTFIVRDTKGQPCPDIPVMSRSSSGTTREITTELSGTAVIIPGEHDVLGVYIDGHEFHFRPRAYEYELFPPDCSAGITFKVTLREDLNPTVSEFPRFADELPGYRFLRNAPWRHLLSPATSTEDVLGFMGRPDKEFTDHPSAAKGGNGRGPKFRHLKYDNVIPPNWTMEFIMTVGDPTGDKTDRLSRVKYIPKKPIDFRTVKLSPHSGVRNALLPSHLPSISRRTVPSIGPLVDLAKIPRELSCSSNTRFNDHAG